MASSSLSRPSSSKLSGVYSQLKVEPGALALANHAAALIGDAIFVFGGENAQLKKLNELKAIICP